MRKRNTKKQLGEGKAAKRWKNRTKRKKMQNAVDLKNVSKKEEREERKRQC